MDGPLVHIPEEGFLLGLVIRCQIRDFTIRIALDQKSRNPPLQENREDRFVIFVRTAAGFTTRFSRLSGNRARHLSSRYRRVT
jgi:hypothetical protein